MLVDSEPIISQAHADALTQCGYAVAAQDINDRFCGMTDPEILDVIEREWGRALPASYAERVALIIEENFLQSLTAIEGVAEALDWLPLPACVASSSTLQEIRRKLELTALLSRFGENLFSATMVTRGKPAPDLFLHAAQRLATPPDRCLVIEDSPAGIDAALAADMTAIGFSGGSHCGPEHGARLWARGAVLVIADMHELAPAIAQTRVRHAEGPPSTAFSKLRDGDEASVADSLCSRSAPRAPQRCGSPTRIRATRQGEPRHSLRSAMPFPVRPKRRPFRSRRCLLRHLPRGGGPANGRGDPCRCTRRVS